MTGDELDKLEDSPWMTGKRRGGTFKRISAPPRRRCFRRSHRQCNRWGLLQTQKRGVTPKT